MAVMGTEIPFIGLAPYQGRELSQDEVDHIIHRHELWLVMRDSKCYSRSDPEVEQLTSRLAKKADFRGAILTGLQIEGNLSEAYFDGANLENTNWSGTFTGCQFYHANLQYADMRYADFRDASFVHTDMTDANIYGALFTGALIRNCKGAEVGIPMTCPDTGSFIGWKKSGDGFVIKLLIPEDAARSSAAGRKCRCSKATVLDIQTLDGESADAGFITHSWYDPQTKYYVGKTLEVEDFCTNRFEECAHGIHFFINRQEAVDYRF